MAETSNLRFHAERELDAIGETGAMRDHLLRMVDAFAAEGHSGLSAAHAANALNKLFRFEPLAPLTGDDSEWMEVSDNLWQNLRCSHVFKNSGGAYDIQGRVFREPNGVCFTNCESSTPVTFPYTPKTEYVDVAEGGEPLPAPVAASEPVAFELLLADGSGELFYNKNDAEENAPLTAPYTIRPLVCDDTTHPSVAAGTNALATNGVDPTWNVDTELEKAAPLVELDEWCVVTKDGASCNANPHITLDDAKGALRWWDDRHPQTAPHRVMRVCLLPVEVDAERGHTEMCAWQVSGHDTDCDCGAVSPAPVPPVVTENKPPQPAFTVEISVGACDWERLAVELVRAAEHVQEHGQHCNRVWGGAGTHGHVHITTRDVTPEQYNRELSEWLHAPRNTQPAASEVRG